MKIEDNLKITYVVCSKRVYKPYAWFELYEHESLEQAKNCLTDERRSYPKSEFKIMQKVTTITEL